MMGVRTFRASIEDGTAKAKGDTDILGKIAGTLYNFEIGFEILPGTAGPAAEKEQNPYEVVEDSIFTSGE